MDRHTVTEMKKTRATVPGTTNSFKKKWRHPPMPTLIYAIPLSLSISLVYCATRYELPSRIFSSAATMFVKILVGMAVIYGLLTFFSS